MNPRLVRPTTLSVRAGRHLETEFCWQMAVLGRGMKVRAGAGVGFVQWRMVTACDPSDVTIGLVRTGASVVDGQFPGIEGSTGQGGWDGRGRVDCTLPGPTPAANDAVKFGQGDRVMLVPDCRTGPVVRLLVNGQLRLVHALTQGNGVGSFVLTSPAVAVCSLSSLTDQQQACVELEYAQLPPGWDGNLDSGD